MSIPPRTPGTPNQALQRTAPGVCQRPPALPFGLPAAGYVAPLHSACAPATSNRPATDPLTTPTALRPTPNRLRPHRLRRPPQSLSLGSLGL
jgi:hypothetical protein